MSKEATHTVIHRNFYLAVRGKLQHFPVGSTLTLSDKQAKGMGSRVSPINGDDTVDLSGAGDAAVETLAALKAEAAELGIEGAERWGEKRLRETIEDTKAGNSI